MSVRYRAVLQALRQWPLKEQKAVQGDLSYYLRHMVQATWGERGEATRLTEEEKRYWARWLISLNRLATDHYRNKYRAAAAAADSWSCGISRENLAGLMSDDVLKELEKSGKVQLNPLMQGYSEGTEQLEGKIDANLPLAPPASGDNQPEDEAKWTIEESKK